MAYEGLHFDSDQAVFGFDGQTPRRGRAPFHFYQYGYHYLLAVSVWLAAHVRGSVRAVRCCDQLPAALAEPRRLRLCCSSCLWPEVQLSVRAALRVCCRSCMPSVAASSRLIEHQGGIIEPFVPCSCSGVSSDAHWRSARGRWDPQSRVHRLWHRGPARIRAARWALARACLVARALDQRAGVPRRTAGRALAEAVVHDAFGGYPELKWKGFGRGHGCASGLFRATSCRCCSAGRAGRCAGVAFECGHGALTIVGLAFGTLLLGACGVAVGPQTTRS